MSDRIKGFYVALEKDIKDEDFKEIKNAVLMVKGVLKVKESISDPSDWMNRERIRNELITKVFEIFKVDK